MLGPEGDQIPDRDAPRPEAVTPLDDGAEELTALGETDRVESAGRVLEGVDESREGGELGADERDVIVCVAEKGRPSVEGGSGLVWICKASHQEARTGLRDRLGRGRRCGQRPSSTRGGLRGLA